MLIMGPEKQGYGQILILVQSSAFGAICLFDVTPNVGEGASADAPCGCALQLR